MSQSLAAEILILAQQEATARRWARMLDGPENRIWLAAEEVPDPARLDLILTDRPVADPPRTGSCQPGQSGEGATDTAGPGVIRVGSEGPADVRLPADVTQRELQLAGRLLAEVVRLRRESHARTETHRRLAEEALTDPLTGLPNRRAWDRSVQRWLDLPSVGHGNAPPNGQGGPSGRLCLAIIDLDHFKRINDTHGHAAGDDVLRAAGKVISGSLRESDFVARLGGDEFGLLLSVADEATARAVVDRVRSGLPSGLARRGTHAVNASAGFHLPPSDSRGTPLPSPESLFIDADTALREAKSRGRDRTVGSREWGVESQGSGSGE